MKRAARLFSFILVLAAFAFMALGSDSDSYSDSTGPSPTAAVNQPSASKTPDVSPTPGSTSNPISGKPEKNGFNEKTNITIDLEQISFSVPDYWKNGEQTPESYMSFVEESDDGNKVAAITISFVESDNASFAELKVSTDNGELGKKLSSEFDNPTELRHEYYKNSSIAGYLFNWECMIEGLPAKVFCLVAPVSNSSGFIFSYCYEINADYSYYEDYIHILDSIEEARILTAKNNADLRAILTAEYVDPDQQAKFIKKYKGRIVEFDAIVLHMQQDPNFKTICSYVVIPGSELEKGEIGAALFYLENMSSFDFKWDKATRPEYLTVGSKIRIQAEIISGSDPLYIYLDPVCTWGR